MGLIEDQTAALVWMDTMKNMLLIVHSVITNVLNVVYLLTIVLSAKLIVKIYCLIVRAMMDFLRT